VVLCNIGCDQISKQIVRERIGYLERISVIGDIFTLTKIENEGAFLSFGDTLPYAIKLLLLTILPIVALLYGIYIMYRKNNLSTLTIFGIAFILGGGIGNLYDRIRYGSVTDFMHIDFFFFQTGIFNIADVSIMIGMSLMIYNSYFFKNRQTQ
jgi:signal peptidase II